MSASAIAVATAIAPHVPKIIAALWRVKDPADRGRMAEALVEARVITLAQAMQGSADALARVQANDDEIQARLKNHQGDA